MNESDDEQLEALREAFNLEAEDCKLLCWDPPCKVAGLGWVASMSLVDAETYRGPSADLVLGNDDTTVAQALEIALEAVGRLVTIGLHRSLELGLEIALDLPTLALDQPGVVQMLGGPDAEQRRSAALRICTDRFDAVAAKLKDVFGLIAPRHLISWAALVRSLNSFERRGLSFIGRRPGGIMMWFEDGGLERKPCDGLDPRLDCRFRCDPPEFVTIAWGESDGLHYGLWYDDPSQPPSTIVANYARDSAETWDQRQPSMILLLRKQIDELMRNVNEPRQANLSALAAAVEAFVEPDARLREADPKSIWAGVRRPQILGDMGPALRPSDGDARGRHVDSRQRAAAYQARGFEVQGWIKRARAELAAGKPAFALVLGRELHWFDADDYREVGLELMVGAYRALGRDALAEIALVHHANRSLGSVGVY
ncbi:hypothetical protein DB30_03479 [Enhygromyxa salina]|uniref:Uncharacterized protein n=1 Tax=Enhygromyxa salina TaxID=215803 RepID=A0A0C2D228_9BACT|nr:ADP-ribosylation family protein [Enhygromyxa salina]KIG17296.1 hypothetical protein DB30_03479 [Enhygromyxa salina]